MMGGFYYLALIYELLKKNGSFEKIFYLCNNKTKLKPDSIMVLT